MITEVSRDTAIQWCLKNAFELVELSSSAADSDGSDEGLLFAGWVIGGLINNIMFTLDCCDL